MKIIALHPSYDESKALFSELDPTCDPARHCPGHTWTHASIHKRTAARQVAELAREGCDVFFNLCDGAWEEDTAGIEVVQTLERLGVAFTGAGSGFFDPTRVGMKMAAHAAGVSVPAYIIAHTPEDAPRAAAELRFPMLVKHPQGYSSVGMTRDSRVTDTDGLVREITRIVGEYGSALVEEFVDGREFTALVTEGRGTDGRAWALDPVEFTFPEGETFKHFDLKWKDFERMTTVPVTVPALAAKLREAAAGVFEALGGSGFARCDFRLSTTGEVFFLEINPNCGVFYPEGSYGSADFILARDPGGHRGFLQHLIDCALRRRDRMRRAWDVHYDRAHGFGLAATEAIPRGAVAVRYEETPHVLASRAHVHNTFHGLRKRWAEAYAWPIAQGVQVLWSDDPESWRPINHGCDPNTWLEGLDLVARRDIAPGEQLTVDYATFSGPGTSPFECRCGSPACRRVVLDTDYLLPEVRARFGNHVSDFVKTNWEHADPQWIPPHDVQPATFGLGLIARRPWAAGEIMSALSWTEKVPQPTRWTIQCGEDAHAEPLPFELRYINHGCDPNVQFDIEAGVLRALRDIVSGEELRFFYPGTEWAMAEPFTCHCGAAACIGTITGAALIPREVLSQYALSPVIARRLAQRDSLHRTEGA